MKKNVLAAMAAVFLLPVALLTVVGLHSTADYLTANRAVSVQTELPASVPAPESAAEAPNKPSPGWTVKEPTEAGNVAVSSQSPSASFISTPDGRLFIQKDRRPTEAGYDHGAEAPSGMQRPYVAGPVAASVGELCVFRLNDAKTYADWCIVPEATCYVDSSGSSLAFASNHRGAYTILAAIVEDGVPKILTHVCEYGLSPQPDPEPSPSPTPKPNPAPNITLTDWVSQNVPQAGRHQCAALASCYEATASAIDGGSIVTQAAAYSTIRTASQTKIDLDLWSDFLEALSGRLNMAMDGSTDVGKLATHFEEIAAGLKERQASDVGHQDNVTETQEPDILPFVAPQSSSTCPDPTGKACQPQPNIEYRRRAR